MNLDHLIVRRVLLMSQRMDLLPFFCKYRNSEGKYQDHDLSDIYRRWGWRYWRWRIWYPRRSDYRKCVRCGYEVRILRRGD